MRSDSTHWVDRNRSLILAFIMALCSGFGGADLVAAAGVRRLVPHTGHSKPIFTVAVSPDGRFVATGGADRTARIWEAATGNEIHRLTNHPASISSVAFSPDGMLVATGSGEGARIWLNTTGQEKTNLRGESHAGPVSSVAFSADGRYLLTGSWDAIARVWEIATGKEVRRLKGHAGPISSVAFSGNAALIATAGQDGARIWKRSNGREWRTLEGHAGWVNSVAFSPDGEFVVTGGDDGSTRIFEVATGQKKYLLEGHGGPVASVAFSPVSNFVLTGGKDGIARIWDYKLEVTQCLTNDGSPITGVAYFPDGKSLVTATRTVARIWDATGSNILTLEGLCGSVNSVAFSTDGLFLLTAEENTARIWDNTQGREIRALQGHTLAVNSAAYSKDGNFIVTGSSDGTARIWENWKSTNQSRTLRGHAGPVRSLAISTNSQSIVTGSDDHTAAVWDTGTGIKRHTVTNNDKVSSVAISPDGKAFVTGSLDGKVRIWDTTSGAQIHLLTNHGDRVTAVAFSPDGGRVATASWDYTVRIWNSTSGEEERLLRGVGASGIGERISFTTVAFSPEGRFLAAGRVDGSAQIWDTESNALPTALSGHDDVVNSIAFSPDSQMVVTGSSDGTARLWNRATGSERCTLVSFHDGTWAVVAPWGQYDSSNNGDVVGLHWVAGNESIKLQQSKTGYWEPGFLSKILGINREKLRAVDPIDDSKGAPGVHVIFPNPQDPLSFQIALTNRGGGIGPVVVALNGIEVIEDARGNNSKAGATNLLLTVSIRDNPKLITGAKNLIEVYAFNADSTLASPGFIWQMTPAGKSTLPDDKPNLWGIVAGVTDYSGYTDDLNYTKSDALAMEDALKRGAVNLLGGERVHVMTFEESGTHPSKDNIRGAFERLSSARSIDIVVVYLSGHGVDVGGRYYFLTEGAVLGGSAFSQPDNLENFAISGEEIVSWCKKSPANKRVMILDTCRAGTIARAFESRGISSEEIRAVERLKSRNGFHLLMGCAKDAKSYAPGALQQSFLTYALLEGMRGMALRNERFVDVGILFRHVETRVNDLAQSYLGVEQHPRNMAGPGMTFDIGRLEHDDRKQIRLATKKPVLLPPVLVNATEGFDDLKLTTQLRRHFENSSYATLRGATNALPALYVDASEVADAYRPSGTYTVKNGNLEVRLALVQNEAKVKELPAVRGSAANTEAFASRLVKTVSLAINELEEARKKREKELEPSRGR